MPATATTTDRRRARRPSPAALAEAGVYAVAIALVVWPGILHARTQILGAGDDARYYTWLGWRMGWLIAKGHVLPWRAGSVIRPFGLDLRLLDGYLPSYVSGLFNLVCGPVLAVNLTYVTGAVLNVCAARALARRLSSRRVVHAIVAVAFLTAPPIALNVQLGLLPLFFAFTAPLLVADGLDVVTGARRVRVVRLAILLTLAYLCSVYFLVFGGLAYGVLVGVAAVRARSWSAITATVGAVALTVLVLLPFIVPRVAFDRRESARGIDTELRSDADFFSADAASVVAQPTRSTFLLPRPGFVERSIVRLPDVRYAIEATIFPGFLLLGGLVVFCFARDRRRLPLLLASGVLFVFGLGPSLKFGGRFLWTHGGNPVSWLPYRLLLWVPGLGALRAPVRVEYVLVALLAAATAIVLDRPPGPDRRPVRDWHLGLGAALVLSTNLLVPLPTTTFGTTPASADALRAVARLARPGDTVLSVPSDCDPAFVSLQVYHRTAVVGCAGSFAANPWSKMRAYTESPALTKLRCDLKAYGRIPTPGRDRTRLPAFDANDVASLRSRFHVRFVVVDHTKLGPDCKGAELALPVLRGYTPLGGDARYEVIDLGRAAG